MDWTFWYHVQCSVYILATVWSIPGIAAAKGITDKQFVSRAQHCELTSQGEQSSEKAECKAEGQRARDQPGHLAFCTID